MTPKISSVLLVVFSFAAVTGVRADPVEDPPLDPQPQRGELLVAPPELTGSYTGADLIAQLAEGPVAQLIVTRAFSPRCSVDVHHMQYGTVGARGESTTASAALMIPRGQDPVCQGPRPLVLYAHGKRNLRSFNLANLSGDSNYEAIVIALALAGQGYVVVAPNYAGYDTSTLPYHAFLHAEQQSNDMMDALTAARTAFLVMNAAVNEKLFVTGYSQGGHVAMATHRALEAAGESVTASAPMSGPYAMSAFADSVFLGQVGAGAVEEFAMLVSSYQNAYGNIYSSPGELFEPNYLSADTLIPGESSGDGLVAQGLLPDDALFSNTPPTPELAPLTPATEPRIFADVFARGFAADHLITNPYRLGYLQDVQAAPDGGYPDTTTGLPPAAPGNAFRQALKNNDLRNWTPVSPMFLCAGGEDPVVFYLNTELMQGYWAANAPTAPVTVVNVDAPPSSGDPYEKLKQQFAETKNLIRGVAIINGATDGGQAAVLQDYHDLLVPASCMQASKAYFDSF
jgi:hypothetical protein